MLPGGRSVLLCPSLGAQQHDCLANRLVVVVILAPALSAPAQEWGLIYGDGDAVDNAFCQGGQAWGDA